MQRFTVFTILNEDCFSVSAAGFRVMSDRGLLEFHNENGETTHTFVLRNLIGWEVAPR